MERPRALFILEGASGSRRRELAAALPSDGFIVILGMPSQYRERNKLLTPDSQVALGDVDLNYGRALNLSAPEGQDLMQRCISVASIQYTEAVRLMNEGNIVFLESSSIRLANLCYMASQIALKKDVDEVSRVANEMAKKAMKAVTLENTVTGFVLMTDIYKRATEEGRTSMTGLDEMESINLQRTIAEIHFGRGFPICPLDPNTLSLEDQRQTVRLFTTKP